MGIIQDVIMWIDLFEPNGEKQKPQLPNQVVIMAGGRGERLDPFYKNISQTLNPFWQQTYYRDNYGAVL